MVTKKNNFENVENHFYQFTSQLSWKANMIFNNDITPETNAQAAVLIKNGQSPQRLNNRQAGIIESVGTPNGTPVGIFDGSVHRTKIHSYN